MTDPADGWPPGPGRHGRAKASGRPRSFPGRYQWYGALLAGIAAAALATGAILLMNNHDGRLASSGCGLVSCSAALPESTSAAPRVTPTAQPTPAHHRAAATPAPSPSPSATAPSVPSASPAPSASHHGHGHGHGHGHHGHAHGGPPLTGSFQGT